jgi:Domain of unknown function (DUF4265)
MSDRNQSEDGLTRIVFELEESDWHDHSTESVWATAVGHDRYRIQNVPFYAYGVSYDDVVIAKASHGQLVFQGVSQRGGHSTYRVILNGDTTNEEFEAAWQKLESLGCTYERAGDRLIAIDVPPETNIYEAYDVLQAGERTSIWGFEEAHCGHPLKCS